MKGTQGSYNQEFWRARRLRREYKKVMNSVENANLPETSERAFELTRDTERFYSNPNNPGVFRRQNIELARTIEELGLQIYSSRPLMLEGKHE